MTPQKMANLIAGILNYERDLSKDEEWAWMHLDVSEPVVNTLIVATPEGEHFLVNVKKVSK